VLNSAAGAVRAVRSSGSETSNRSRLHTCLMTHCSHSTES
jgi:hypothetical protein